MNQMENIIMQKRDLKICSCKHRETLMWIVKFYCVLLVWQYIAN